MKTGLSKSRATGCDVRMTYRLLLAATVLGVGLTAALEPALAQNQPVAGAAQELAFDIPLSRSPLRSTPLFARAAGKYPTRLLPSGESARQGLAVP